MKIDSPCNGIGDGASLQLVKLATPRLKLTAIAPAFSSNIVHHGHDGFGHRIQQEDDVGGLFSNRGGNFGFEQLLETSPAESNGDQPLTCVESQITMNQDDGDDLLPDSTLLSPDLSMPGEFVCFWVVRTCLHLFALPFK
jgi:hypothetical protein